MHIGLQQNYRKQNNSFGAILRPTHIKSSELPCFTKEQYRELSGIVHLVSPREKSLDKNVDTVNIGATREAGNIAAVWVSSIVTRKKGIPLITRGEAPLPKGTGVFEHCKQLLKDYARQVSTDKTFR